MTHSLTRGALFASLALLAGTSFFVAPARAQSVTEQTNWFKNAKYGVFVHHSDVDRSAGWNATVNAFDANAFANRMADAGAGYVIFTVGQGSGFYCAPNATYENYVGAAPNTKCSTRNLINDVADALYARGIRTIAYMPATGPKFDTAAMNALGYTLDTAPSQAFQTKWEGVLRTFSNSFGTKVSGWWIDGCYWPSAYGDFSQARNWNTFASALKSGNSSRILAFNPGVNKIEKMTDAQHYAAGEYAQFTPIPSGRLVSGIQWHLLGYLGTYWAEGSTRNSDATMISYIKNVSAKEGVVSMDVRVDKYGNLTTAQLNQLIAIKKGVRSFTLQAENYSGQSGVGNYGSGINDCDGGDYVYFDNVNLIGGYTRFTARVATPNTGRSVEIRLDSPTGERVGTLNLNSTGSWSSPNEQTTTLSNARHGVRRVYLVFSGSPDAGNFDWFRFHNG